MFAIIETGGKQYRAEKGAILHIEKLPEAEGKTVTFDRVFLFSDGKETKVGTPFVEGITVKGKVVKHDRNEKIRVVKFQPKKRHKTVRGHRQHFTEIEITGITAGTKKKAAPKKAEKEEEVKKEA